ncbi:isocitrate lyase/phosphoenolpyruvate mutase family protein [Sphingosinicella sp. LHD-64]|uniref:isocitrate lyase/PEP mutase family protein n=1 Tax=Sphingosinicella sp. LHD-64 TaxID=3072139 RepID=UPI00280D292E|nr:isocitrate lyase/phosphoenolpyruvate mutase family protein [Sphingosinicella sp. LHD-64]MDQ8756673.1 isocitrate lyase/phosphoenolpyruvate mutase family protein [Sphingosinicella sp. LHD-64]
MPSQSEKAALFAALHRPGDPVILYNIWDAGSARAVAEAGARALATGSASVAAANGFADGEGLPMAAALDNAARIVAAVELPVTVDFEGGYALAPEGVAANLKRLAETGAIGCNFEDQVVGGEGLHMIPDQVARIRAAREAVGADFFINARTDIFLQAKPDTHDDAKVDQAIARVDAYADAGASGFFVPGLANLALLERVCAASPIPVNFMAFPGAPSAAEVAGVGVARISHGPFPHMDAMKVLTAAAREIYAG